MVARYTARNLSQDQRRALAYVKANEGVTTRNAGIALQRSPIGMLNTLRALEDRGLVRSTWPNRPGEHSFQWYFIKEPEDA